MRNLVIRVDDLIPGADAAQKNGHYPVRLYCEEDGRPDWLATPLAQSSIPENLSVPAPVEDPVTRRPLEGEKIRTIFLETRDTSPRVKAIGEHLYQLLFQGDVAAEWARLCREYPGERSGVSEGRRIFLDIRPAALDLLPWELLQTPPLPMFFDSRNPVSRGAPALGSGAESFSWPIHALIVVGSAENDPAVKAEEEIRAIQCAFIKSKRPIDWEVRRRPTKAELAAEIAQFKPQIFHFIGHGKSVPGQPVPVLELSDRRGVEPPEEWTVADVAIDLVAWQPRFALINACRSSDAQTKEATQEVAWTITASFASAGVPAVLGMQSDVDGAAAAAFAGKLYESFGGGAPLDQAVAEARAAVRALPGVTHLGRDWSLPTLRLRCLPDHLLPMQPDIDAGRSRRFELDSKLRSVGDFVDRKPLRRSVWYGVDPTPHHDELRHLLIVKGVEEAGKTSLVKASLKMCALRRRNVAYVDIGYNETMNFLGVLRAIRQGDTASGSLICPRLPDAAMADFDAAYGHLLSRPGADAEVAGDPALLDGLFASFRDALARAAAAEPLIVALDHMNIEKAHSTQYLVPHLLHPVARGEVEGVRMILVGTPTELSNLLTGELTANARVIEVPLWPSAEFEPLAQEFCLYNGVSLEDAGVTELIRGSARRTVGEWKPARLRTLLELINQT